MGSYNEFANELMGYVPSLSFLLAQKAVNRAWRDIKESRLWSFLVVEGVITVPSAISTGSVSVTQYSNSFTMNATAITALAGLNNPVITFRQIRIGQGPVYSITTYDDVSGIGTFDKVYMESTSGAASFNCYQCYYPAPVTDFLRWITITDPTISTYFKLRWDRARLDKMDPQRTSTGTPYALVPFKTNATTGVPLFEMWPHPQTAVGLLTMYQRRGVDFSAGSDSLPPQIPDDMLMTRARIKAYEWAIANVGRYPELRGVSWVFVMQEAQAEYAKQLQKCHIQDEETFSQNFIVPGDGEGYLGPVDAKWMQSHGSWW
jgi:hypothetical protein